MLPVMEPCFLESFQWCWVETCLCGVTSLLSFCPGLETHVLILDDCTSTSCCVQSWSTLPALPVDFYLKPAEELKHLLWKWGGGRGKKRKLPKSDPNPGGPISLDSLLMERRGAFFWTLLWKPNFRHWGACPEGGCWKDSVPGRVTATWGALVSTSWTFALTVLWVGFCKHHSKTGF